MNPNKFSFAAALAWLLAATCPAQGGTQGSEGQQGNTRPNVSATAAGSATFAGATEMLQQQLADAIARLNQLRDSIAAERQPLVSQQREREARLESLRREVSELDRTANTNSLEVSNLTGEIKQREDQSTYLSNLLGEYVRNFESRLHIVEAQRYTKQLEQARLALQNTTLSADEVFATQLDVVALSIDHLDTALGGARFEGRAVAGGLVKPGTFVMVGPSAVFRAADGSAIGSVEEVTGSQEPTVVPYQNPLDREAAAQLVLGTGGAFPLDATLGNAQKVESIRETWWEHVQKGGPVMVPMFCLAGASLLVVLLKWLSMAFVRRPSQRQVDELFQYVEEGDHAAAAEHAESLPGPSGAMLRAGAQQLGEPRELVEEVMYEQVLTTRLRLNSWLPFVAICATSAPLLGLLGTVTGIMNTFRLMTEFGTGNPKTLSGGISEALITTEYGLIVAIPSLLLHAFLSRKARGILDGMERTAVQFMNRVRTPAPVREPEAFEIA